MADLGQLSNQPEAKPATQAVSRKDRLDNNLLLGQLELESGGGSDLHGVSGALTCGTPTHTHLLLHCCFHVITAFSAVGQ